MNRLNEPGRTMRPTKNWDLKLAAILFIGTCITVSLILPNWQQPAAMTEIYETVPSQLQTENTSPAAATPAAPSTSVNPPANPPPNPELMNAASESYQKGLDLLQAGNFSDAEAEFKKALEKYPNMAEAYTGLADAFSRLGDDKAAETNARHALDQLKLLRPGLPPDLHLKKELAYAHRVLGTALLHLAKSALDSNEETTGRMKALDAASHCSLANVFDQADQDARACAQQAHELSTHS